VSLHVRDPLVVRTDVGAVDRTTDGTAAPVVDAAVPGTVAVAPAGLRPDAVLDLHRRGKIEMRSTVPLRGVADLSMAYTPGVAQVCRAIAGDPALADTYTWRRNAVAVVTDGTAVLGLGDIGPAAALPVMEGKALLFKEFAGVDAVPLCLDTVDVDEIVETVVRLAPSFGGINLEDISAPRCFEIERRLVERLDIPVFHDDQHGTAVVVLAALGNAARITGRRRADLRVVVSGAGAAGVAVTALLRRAGTADVVVCDRRGVVHPDRSDLTAAKRHLAAASNPRGVTGHLADALVGADVFVGLSGGTVSEAALAVMADDPILFPLANPTPEIPLEVARRRSRVVATGRSDLPNQINNVLAFPGIFRGALDCGARRITPEMTMAAAAAVERLADPADPARALVPSAFDRRVAPAVAEAVATAWSDSVASTGSGTPGRS
jgi:malate dehydrogenase (oxaloacetate-decarboxylating)